MKWIKASDELPVIPEEDSFVDLIVLDAGGEWAQAIYEGRYYEDQKVMKCYLPRGNRIHATHWFIPDSPERE